MLSSRTKTILIGFVIVVLAVVVFSPVRESLPKVGFANDEEANYATTTSPTIHAFNADRAITSTSNITSGIFTGFVVSTAGGAGGFIELYDATTTNPSLRAGSMSSTTQFITSIPTNLAAGYYPYNVRFNYGLAVAIRGAAGTLGTTTILYKITSSR